MKRTSIVLSAVLATLITGCTTFHASQPSVDLATKVSGNINADIDVGDKISGDSKVVTLLGFINFGDDKFADGINDGAANFSSETAWLKKQNRRQATKPYQPPRPIAS